MTPLPTATNPLLCDPVQGICEMPGAPAAAADTVSPGVRAHHKPVKVLYFTDPICSTCWGIEPQLRKLKLEYGAHLEIEYRMGGLLPSWEVYNSGGISKPSDVAHHWDEVSHHYQMPIDGDVWLEDPLPSSYPPSVAFKAAELQDHQKALLFLRRIREMVFLEKKNITRWEHLHAAATQVGLDTARFKTDYHDGPAQKAFEADLALARQMGVRGFPTLFFSTSEQDQVRVYGFKPYVQMEQAVKMLYPDALKTVVDTTPLALFAHYPTLTTQELAVLSEHTFAEAETLLGQLLEQKVIEKRHSKNGPLWVKK